MALIAIVINAFNQSPVNYGVLIVMLIGTTLVYTGKNVFIVSDSPSGTINWKDILSGLIIAIGTGLTQYIAMIVTGTEIDWLIFGKVVASVSLTYLAGTFLSPETPLQRKFIGSQGYDFAAKERADAIKRTIMEE